MQRNYLIIFFFVFSATLTAQNFKYGKVSKEELAEKQNASYPEADATVLFRSVNITYSFREGEGFSTKTEVHKRVKIYNKNGEDWATRKFKTYNSGADRESFDVKGATFNLVNGSVKKEKLSNSAVFEERYSKYRVHNKFTMPNIAPGSVIEYVYTIVSPFSQIDDLSLIHI